jgi:hypothetical protein
MTDLPGAYIDTLDMRAVLAEIDRDRIESQKFAAEQHRLMAEAAKRDERFNRYVMPWVPVAALIGGIGGGIGIACAFAALLLAIARSKGCAP